MRLKDYARQQGISYRTAWRWWKAGKLPGQQMDTGTILLESRPTTPGGASQGVAIYARVSLAETKSNLDSQAERLSAYCASRGYPVSQVVKEVGSGINDARPKLLALLADQGASLIVVEHKERLTRFGFHYLETLLHNQGRAIEVVNQVENGTEDLLADLTASVYSVCARLYGQRRAKRKTEVILRELEAKEEADATG